MRNKFILDSNYEVQLLCNIQEPYDDVEEWKNSILVEVDTDSTLNQYIVITGAEGYTDTLDIVPGQTNTFTITMDFWNYGGISTIEFYKNNTLLSDKTIYITFPDILPGVCTISSDSESEGIIYLGQNYSMSGSYYSSPEVIKEIEQSVEQIEGDVENMGEDIETAKSDIDDLKTDKQDALSAGTGISIASDTVSVTHPIVLSTEDLTPNVSPLPTGTIYLVYE